METLIMQYLLPLAMLGLILLVVSLRIRSYGGPVAKFLRFFALFFGPSLIYAAVEDDSSGTLLLASLVCALVVEGVILWKERAVRAR